MNQSAPVQMKWAKILSAVIVSVAALFLVYLSSQRALAGLHFYQATRFFVEDNLVDATSSNLKALAIENRNPDFYDLQLILAWNQAQKTKDIKDFEAVIQVSEKMTELIPRHAKAMLYQGLALIKTIDSSDEISQELQRDKIKKSLYQAVKLAPGNAWIKFMAAKGLLTQREFLSEMEIITALGWIEKSVQHQTMNTRSENLGEPSPYLNSALELLWQLGFEFKDWIRIVPETQISYKQFLQFLEEKEAWESHAFVYKKYLEFLRTEYETLCMKADDFFLRGRVKQAYEFYKKAFWMQDWPYPWAKVGILAVEEKLGSLPSSESHPLLGSPLKESLISILREEEEPLGKTWLYLESVVDKVDDAYVHGLFELRREDFLKAAEFFEKMPKDHPERLRLLATAYGKSKTEQQKGVDLLLDNFSEENPDHRNLSHLEAWEPAMRSWILNKKKVLIPFQYSPKKWWTNEGMNQVMRDDRTYTMRVNLPVGKSKVQLLFKSTGSENPYVRISLEGKPQKGVYVNSKNWMKTALEIDSTGGKRYLQVEMLNSRDDEAAELTLGPVKVSTL